MQERSDQGCRRRLVERIQRLIRFRLVIPIKRSRHPPEYTARGVGIGLAWGLTPLIGIQLAIVFANWLAFRPFRRLDFGLFVALAWVWVSNAVTMLPMYYGFYVTGQVLLGNWDDLTGYEGFVARWTEVFANGDGLWTH